jgi:hypothetical protein
MVELAPDCREGSNASLLANRTLQAALLPNRCYTRLTVVSCRVDTMSVTHVVGAHQFPRHTLFIAKHRLRADQKQHPETDCLPVPPRLK